MTYYFTLPVTKDIAFVQPRLELAAVVFQLIDSDRKHLEEFLDFVEITKEIKDEEIYLKMKLTGEANGTDRLFFISYQGELVGTIDLHFIDHKNKKADIGYWIHSDFIKKGIMTASVHKICDIAFEDLDLNKLTIIADSKNIASNGVAKKCGFTFVATDKEESMLYGELRDTNRYALLKRDYLK
ncbi:MAG: GNAT family protein [Vagococcus sp.]|uniref:GNAT family N-acetyltransferase n=1 Tax=Vagococcus sp. TaxID=1933889 RepID=UPI002FC65941